MNDIQIFSSGVGVESFFFRMLDPLEDRGVWLKFTFLKTDPIQFRIWSVYFSNDGQFEIGTKTMPIADVSFGHGIIYWPGGQLDFLGQCFGCTDKHIWEFNYDVIDNKPVMLLPEFLYSNSIPTTKLITPSPRISVSGNFYSGKDNLFNSYVKLTGMQGHNWGPKHSREYAWMSALSPILYVEGFTTSIFPFKFTSMCIRYGKIDYHFSDVLSPIRLNSYSSFDDFKWRVKNKGFGSRFKISCVGSNPRAGLIYKNPDGSHMTCFNNNLSSVYVTLKTDGRIVGDVAIGALEFLRK